MKQKYLNDLKNYLEDKHVLKEEIDNLIVEYEELYDQAFESELNHEVIVKKLGSPKFIYYSLKDDIKRGYKTNKMSAIMVFISIILFFVVGQAFDLWAYSWMFFLLIPIAGILSGKRKLSKLPAITVFISIIIFMIMGMSFDLWHPAWLVFLLIPLSGVLINKDDKIKIVGIMPFITTIIYIIFGYMDPEFYLYAWPVFLLIPFFGTLYIDKKKERYVLASLIMLSIIAYYVLSFSLNDWAWTLLVYIIPIVYAIYKKHIKVEIKLFNDLVLALILIITLVVYLVVSLLTGGWAYTWLILMLIPMIGIYSETKFKYPVSFMPFISIILFYSFGYFIEGGWTYSWLFFLLIPMSQIMFPNKKE